MPQENVDEEWPLYVRGHDGIARNLFIQVCYRVCVADERIEPVMFCSIFQRSEHTAATYDVLPFLLGIYIGMTS